MRYTRHHPDQINLTSILTALPDKNGSFFLNKLRKSQHSTLFGLKCTYLVTIFAHFGPKNDGFFFNFSNHFIKCPPKHLVTLSEHLVRSFGGMSAPPFLKSYYPPCIPSSACVEQPLKVLSIQ